MPIDWVLMTMFACAAVVGFFIVLSDREPPVRTKRHYEPPLNMPEPPPHIMEEFLLENSKPMVLGEMYRTELGSDGQMTHTRLTKEEMQEELGDILADMRTIIAGGVPLAEPEAKEELDTSEKVISFSEAARKLKD